MNSKPNSDERKSFQWRSNLGQSIDSWPPFWHLNWSTQFGPPTIYLLNLSLVLPIHRLPQPHSAHDISISLPTDKGYWINIYITSCLGLTVPWSQLQYLVDQKRHSFRAHLAQRPIQQPLTGITRKILPYQAVEWFRGGWCPEENPVQNSCVGQYFLHRTPLSRLRLNWVCLPVHVLSLTNLTPPLLFIGVDP